MLAPLAAETRFPWRPEFRDRGREIGRLLNGAHSETALGPELLADGLAGVRRMIEGIELWRAHPHRRRLPEPPVLARFGDTRLLDYGRGSGVPLLVVPSLVNPAYVLDISRERSLLRYLARQGVRPVLIDWGEPDRESRQFDLGDYVERRILPALDLLRDRAGCAPMLLGYCLGGTLSVAAGCRAPELVSRLALIGAPWDFAAAGGLTAAVLRTTGGMERRRLAHVIEMAGTVFGAVPALWVQEIFAQRDPLQAARKFRDFAGREMDSDGARLFVATEDWLNDGAALAAPAARELLIDFQLDNVTARGRWSPGGTRADPARVAAPTFIAAARRDRITPPGAALPLARAIPGAQLLEPDAGHVGMILGSRAERELWFPLARFLLD